MDYVEWFLEDAELVVECGFMGFHVTDCGEVPCGWGADFMR